jgi:hypothetical protein
MPQKYILVEPGQVTETKQTATRFIPVGAATFPQMDIFENDIFYFECQLQSYKY